MLRRSDVSLVEFVHNTNPHLSKRTNRKEREGKNPFFALFALFAVQYTLFERNLGLEQHALIICDDRDDLGRLADMLLAMIDEVA